MNGFRNERKMAHYAKRCGESQARSARVPRQPQSKYLSFLNFLFSFLSCPSLRKVQHGWQSQWAFFAKRKWAQLQLEGNFELKELLSIKSPSSLGRRSSQLHLPVSSDRLPSRFVQLQVLTCLVKSKKEASDVSSSIYLCCSDCGDGNVSRHGWTEGRNLVRTSLSGL